MSTYRLTTAADLPEDAEIVLFGKFRRAAAHEQTPYGTVLLYLQSSTGRPMLYEVPAAKKFLARAYQKPQPIRICRSAGRSKRK